MIGFYYIYLSKNNQIITKFLKTDNFLEVGDYNSYNHLLVFKAKIINSNVKQLDVRRRFNQNNILSSRKIFKI